MNSSIHLCCYFLPLYAPDKALYLVHHKKADSWIPPGGHCEPNESPYQTVIRECKEELQYNPSCGQVTAFATSVTHIMQSTACRVHLNYWFIIHLTQKIQFKHDTAEFYAAEWMRWGEALARVQREEIKKTLIQLKWNTG